MRTKRLIKRKNIKITKKKRSAKMVTRNILVGTDVVDFEDDVTHESVDIDQRESQNDVDDVGFNLANIHSVDNEVSDASINFASFIEAVNSEGSCMFVLNTICDRSIPTSQLIQLDNYYEKLLETIDNYDIALKEKASAVIDADYNLCQQKIREKIRAIKNRMFKNMNSILINLGLFNMKKKKYRESWECLWKLSFANYDAHEKIFSQINAKFQPIDMNDITCLPHFIVVYLFYRSSLLFIGSDILQTKLKVMLTKILNEGIDPIEVRCLIKDRFVILVAGMSIIKAQGLNIGRGSSGMLQDMITKVHESWNSDAFWDVPLIQFRSNILGSLRLKSQGKKRFTMRNDVVATLPSFEVFQPTT